MPKPAGDGDFLGMSWDVRVGAARLPKRPLVFVRLKEARLEGTGRVAVRVSACRLPSWVCPGEEALCARVHTGCSLQTARNGTSYKYESPLAGLPTPCSVPAAAFGTE